MAAVPPITVPIKVEVSDLDTLRACVQHLQEAQERMVEATQATLALLDALRRPEPTLDATQVHVGRCSRKDAHEDHLHYDHPAAESGEYREPWWCDGNDPDVTEQQERVLPVVNSTAEGVMASLLEKAMDAPLDTEILEGQPKPMPGAGKGPNASLVQGVGLVCPECAQGKRQNCTQVLADGVTRCAYANPEPDPSGKASEDRSCASTVSHVGHVWFADPDPAASKADAPAYYCHGDLR